jgi:dipeptidyl aminopeptidase/acylaminoacyl peptidase
MDLTPISARRRPRHVLPGIALLAVGLVAACGSTAPPTVPSTAAPSAMNQVAAVATAEPSVPTTAPVTLTPLPLPETTPAPFGPAGNGRLVYVDHGNVTWLDLDTSETGVLYAGAPDAASVMPSRDGTKVALISQSSSGRRQLTVLGVDGQDVRTIPGNWASEAEFDWSPSGTDIAIASDDTGLGKLTVAPVDGSNLRPYDLPMDARHLWYLPDGRLLYKGTRETSQGQRFALYTVAGPGSAPQKVTQESAELLDIIDAKPSADGSRLVYHRWREPDEKGRIRLIDVATGKDAALAVDYPTEEFADEIAQFSPGGSQIMFVRFLEAGSQLMLVPASGGTPRAIGELTPGNDAPEATFSPDGRSVLARYHDGHVWVLDATGKGEDRQLDLNVSELPAWQRVAP